MPVPPTSQVAEHKEPDHKEAVGAAENAMTAAAVSTASEPGLRSSWHGLGMYPDREFALAFWPRHPQQGWA